MFLKKIRYTEVLQALADRGISIRVASPKLVMEESPESYKVRLPLVASEASLCIIS